MSNRNELVVREIYGAFGRGDMEGVAERCTDDIVFRIPGQSRVAGEYQGKQEFFGRFLPALAGVADMTTFVETIDALVCDDDQGIILTTQSFRRQDGRDVSFRSAVIFGFRDGLLSEFQEHPGNQVEYDGAWS